MCLEGFEPPTHGLEGRCSIQLSYRHEERVMGIEPTYPAWKAGVLPLNYTRKKSGWQDSNLRLPGPKPGALPSWATPRVYCGDDSVFSRWTFVSPETQDKLYGRTTSVSTHFFIFFSNFYNSFANPWKQRVCWLNFFIKQGCFLIQVSLARLGARFASA